MENDAKKQVDESQSQEGYYTSGEDGVTLPKVTNEPPAMGKLRWFSVCVGLYLTAFLYGLDSTIAADVQGPILASLGSLPMLPWVGTGFLLGSVATVAIFGALYSKVEVKYLYLASILIFEVGSAICGASPSMTAMAIGRVLAGVGGSGIYLGAMTYISIFAPATTRPVYIALTTVFWGLGAVLGPVVGGAFAQSKATWRWAFYINLVLGAATAPIYIFWFPRHGAHRNIALLPRIKNLDWLGALLNASTYSLFITACTYSGSQWQWGSGKTITLWVVTGFVTVMYGVQQWKAILTTEEDRIFPVWCLRSRILLLLHIATFANSAASFFNTYYIPLFFEFTKGDNAITVAVRLLPFVFFLIFGSLLSGMMLPKLNLYAAWYVVSSVLTLIGSSLFFRVTANMAMASLYGYEILVGAGCGITLQLAYSIAMVKVAPEQATAVIGFINVAQLGGGAVTLAIAGTIFQNVGFKELSDALDGRGYSNSEIRAALAGGYSSILRDSSAEVMTIASQAIGKTISTTYGVPIAGAALVFVTALLMPWERAKMA